MTHPITPPPELVQQWWLRHATDESLEDILIEAAQWGYDQCYEEILLHAMHTIVAPPYEPDDDDD